MIVYEHKDYDEYVRVQCRLTSKKTNRGRNYFTWITEENMTRINELIHSYSNGIETIICHGCRCGTEVDVLQKLNPSVKVFGTDLYGKAYQFDRKYFREMDFDTVPEEWKGYFDVVYSNSIDHSRNPINTLLAWKSELKENGICFLNFYWGTNITKEDCFHLDGNDYRAEIKGIGEKVSMNVLYTSEPYKDQYGNICADVVLR